MIRFKLFLVWICMLTVNGQQAPVHPDTLLSSTELIEKYGYPWEIHEITTEDGYLLSIYRIPHGRNDTENNDKPILIMHGLMGVSENFLVTAMNNWSIAFYFADRGYDVWLGNARGNMHSRKHKTLDPSEPKFWRFSWNEIGYYDLPAMIDFILQTTARKRLNYIGHSQGGTVFYVLNSLRPEYQEKITQASLLAPAAFMKHFNNTLLMPLVKAYKSFLDLLENVKLLEFPPLVNMSQFLLQTCFGPAQQGICHHVWDEFVGGDSEETDPALLPIILKYLSTVSVYQIAHYAQGVTSGRFRKWDFGKKKNEEVYGSPEPPDYPIENINIPVAIYYTKADNIVFPKDIIHTCNILPRCTLFKMKHPKFSHFDFAFSKNLMKDLHEPLMKYMQSFD